MTFLVLGHAMDCSSGPTLLVGGWGRTEPVEGASRMETMVSSPGRAGTPRLPSTPGGKLVQVLGHHTVVEGTLEPGLGIMKAQKAMDYVEATDRTVTMPNSRPMTALERTILEGSRKPGPSDYDARGSMSYLEATGSYLHNTEDETHDGAGENHSGRFGNQPRGTTRPKEFFMTRLPPLATSHQRSVRREFICAHGGRDMGGAHRLPVSMTCPASAMSGRPVPGREARRHSH